MSLLKLKLFFSSMENVYLLSAFKTISFIYDVITYPVYLILQQPWYKKHKSNQIKVSHYINIITIFNLLKFLFN